MKQKTLYNILSGAYGEVLETHAMWECIASLGIKPYKDGNQWCYLYGDNIQDGIVGFGETIFKAAWNFYSQIKTEEIAKCEHRGSPEISKDLESYAQKVEDYYDVGEERGYLCVHRGEVKDAVIAGAKWQAEQDQETIELAEDHAYLAGAVNEREKITKEAVEGTYDLYPPAIFLESDIPEVKHGQKVKLIIVKEDTK